MKNSVYYFGCTQTCFHQNFLFSTCIALISTPALFFLIKTSKNPKWRSWWTKFCSFNSIGLGASKVRFIEWTLVFITLRQHTSSLCHHQVISKTQVSKLPEAKLAKVTKLPEETLTSALFVPIPLESTKDIFLIM